MKLMRTFPLLVVSLVLLTTSSYADSELIFNSDNGHAYQRIDTGMTWHNAKEHCEELGSHLATVTSQNENKFIYDHLRSKSNRDCWLGGTDESEEGIWRWTTGENWDYFNWSSGEPNNNGNQDHLTMYRSGKWDDDYGYLGKYSICEWDFSDRIWNTDNGHWYQRIDESMSWHAAKAQCEGDNGYLVTLTSQDEQDFVYDELVSDSPNDCWIGATDEGKDGAWQWFNNEKLKYDNWGTDQPDNCVGLEHSAAMMKTDGAWHDKVSLNNGSGSCDCPIVFEPMSTICEWGDIAGDLNGDNKVNGEDYQEFRKSLGKCKKDSGFNSKADFDEDGCVSYRDYRIWYSEYYMD